MLIWMRDKGGKFMKALRTTAYVSILLLSMVSRAPSETYIGILLDGFQKDCKVHSRGEDFPCEERRQLYKGDTITKLPNVRALKIKWAPYASSKELDATTLVVNFEPPANKKGMLENVKEMVGFVKTKHNVTMGATRGDFYELRVPQPGNNATVIPGQKITFAIEGGSGQYIVFKDSRGKEVFKKDLKGSSSIQLIPEEMGIEPSEVYLWSISGSRSNKQFTMRFLNNEISQQVSADLKEIDKEKLSEAEKGIDRAAYLQFISDAYPQDIDLYWLSYQILKEIKDNKTLKKEDLLVIQELTKNCLKHALETM